MFGRLGSEVVVGDGPTGTVEWHALMFLARSLLHVEGST